MYRIWIRDPVLSLLLDPGWEKTGSEIKFSDHISELLVTIFWVTNTSILCQFCVADLDPGSGMEKSRSGMENGDPGKTSQICNTANV
jgi:hypothetical protein